MADEFDLGLDDDFVFDFTPGPGEEFIHSSSDSANSWIGEIETELMNDNDNNHVPELDQQSVDDFLADLIIDYPSSDQLSDVPVQGEGEIEGTDDADGVAKKRTRRMRNRDAAVRSRERKKEYVKDLETKSKYLERECMRLGRMLQCFVAENHSLRLCLQKGGDNAPMMTRQESAVLLLESLLLGSLLWYLGVIICQYPLPLINSRVETQEQEKLVLSEPGSSIPLQVITWKSRRCKASRPRMKTTLDNCVVRVF